jgi:hypothetical protein
MGCSSWCWRRRSWQAPRQRGDCAGPGRDGSQRSAGFAVAALLANALITGAVANVEDRYSRA